jgi:cytochrome P450
MYKYENENDGNAQETNNNTFFTEKAWKIYTHSPVNLSSITGWRYPGIPRLMGNPIVGRAMKLFDKSGILNNLIEAGKLATNHPSGMCYYWIANKCVLLITKPEHIQHVLVKNDEHIARDPSSSFRILKKFFDTSILIDPHELWKKKRTTYGYWFLNRSSLNSYEPQLKEIIERFISRIQSQENTFQSLEKLFVTFLLEVTVGCLLFSRVTPEKMVKIAAYVSKITSKVVNFNSILGWMLPGMISKLLFDDYKDLETFKTEMKKDFKEILLDLDEEAMRNTDNFLHAIFELDSSKEEHTLLDSNHVFGDISTVLLTAADTTTSTFQFTIKLLCAHPQVEEKLRQELREHLHDKEFSIKNVSEVNYLDMVIKEAMRLYPAAVMSPRDVISPFELEGFPLSKGDVVLYSPYLTHRLNYIWANPEQFDPERFVDKEKIPRYAHIPFGAGPHACVGQQFALLNLKMLLAAIYMKYHIELKNNNFDLNNFNINNGSIKLIDPVMARFDPIDASLDYKQEFKVGF